MLGRHSCTLDSGFWWQKFTFRHVIGSVALFFFFFLLVWHMLVVVRWFVVDELFFPSLLFSLFLKKNYNLIIFIVDISTSILILLISSFVSWLFCKNSICFQFHPSISICHIIFWIGSFVEILFVFNFILPSQFVILFFEFGPHSFDFLGLLLNWFFFSISPLNKIFIFISYFNSDPYSFDYFFVVLLNWIFFSISSFNQRKN
jgi:hypothetical protein